MKSVYAAAVYRVLSCLCVLPFGSASAAFARDGIESRTIQADGVKLHYLVAGRGPAVILLHGYAETSRMWKPLMSRLTEKFTLIAPDLPGIGDSDVPKDGSDMKPPPSASMLSRSRWAWRRRGWSATPSG